MPTLVAQNLTIEEFEKEVSPRKTDANTDPNQNSFEAKIQSTFLSLGRNVARRPKSWLALNLSLALLCFAGIFSPNMKLESRAAKLWVPVDSLAYKSYEYTENTFDVTEYNALVAIPAVGSNVLTKAVFDSLWTVNSAIRLFTLEEGNGKGKTFEDLCLEIGGECAVWSPLGFWSSQAEYEAEVTSDAALLKAVSRPTLASGFPVSRRSLFGFYEEDPDTGELSYAEGVQLVYNLLESRATTEESTEWQAKFLKACGVKGAPESPQLTQKYDGIKVYPNSYTSLDNELSRVISADIPLVVVEYLVMFTFVCAALSYGQRSTKVTLAAGCIGSVFLSTMAGYGVCAACGIPMTILVFILPFILVGIGVDDGFVIFTTFCQFRARQHRARTTALDGAPEPALASSGETEEEEVGEVVAQALSKCAMSIVYTTLTDVAAFSFGCIGTIPAIRYFCAYAAVSVAFDFFFQVTFFVAVLVLDERGAVAREEKSRIIALSSLNSTGEADGLPQGPSSPTPLNPATTTVVVSATRARWEKYVKALVSRRGLVGVAVGTAAFTCFNAWAVTNVRNNFDPDVICPDDSYLLDYFSIARKAGLFWDSSVDYQVIFKDLDFADASVQREAATLLTALAQDTKKSEGPVNWWLHDFTDWAATQASLTPYVTSDGYVDGSSSPDARSAFNAGVASFLTVFPFDRHGPNVALKGDGSVKASRGSLTHFGLATAARKVKAMVHAYKTCEDSEIGINKATPYTQPYVFITQFMVIYRETIVNMLLSFLAVVLVSAGVLGSARAVLVVCLCVCTIDIDLLGLLWVFGYDLNSVTMISLVMAIGLVVDYLAHVTHYFICATDTDPQERMISALDEVGGAVLLGGLTTFVGVLPLAFASSFIYRVFFRLFFAIVALGIFHGLVVVPCLLICAPPPPHGRKKSDVAQSESFDRAFGLSPRKARQDSSSFDNSIEDTTL